MNKLDAQRQKEIQQAEELLFAGPQALGFAKGLFQGHFVSDWVMPYPRIPEAEQGELDQTLAELRKFLNADLDAAEIDRQADIPRSVIDGLGRVGVLGALRTEPDRCGAATWLSMPRPDALKRIQLGPWSLGALHAVVSERLGRAFSRPVMVRIHSVSGGNPFYALELARAIDDQSVPAEIPLSATLFELVHARVGSLGPNVSEALLAAACAAAPTVALVARDRYRTSAHGGAARSGRE